jgi:hypothetical protein
MNWIKLRWVIKISGYISLLICLWITFREITSKPLIPDPSQQVKVLKGKDFTEPELIQIRERITLTIIVNHNQPDQFSNDLVIFPQFTSDFFISIIALIVTLISFVIIEIGDHTTYHKKGAIQKSEVKQEAEKAEDIERIEKD